MYVSVKVKRVSECSILSLDESAEEDWKIKRQVLLEKKVSQYYVMHDFVR